MKNEFSHLLTVEHALGMHALSYAILPAWGIYDLKLIQQQLKDVPERSHIYIIGQSPKISIGPFEQEGQLLKITVKYLNETKIAEFPLQPDMILVENDGYYFVQDANGSRYMPESDHIIAAVGGVPFEVLYIGQAFGSNGERKALDRLITHSRLQEIALKGAKKDWELNIILFELADTMVVTRFNPVPDTDGDAETRIKNGVNKLYGTTLEERVSVYEAALIRYFKPQYNIVFKESFPSTNLKILGDAYEKDFAAIIAEICFDEFPYLLFSGAVEAKQQHIAEFNLHNGKDRNFFFSDEN